jgi:hypothetical protein
MIFLLLEPSCPLSLYGRPHVPEMQIERQELGRCTFILIFLRSSETFRTPKRASIQIDPYHDR